MDSFVSDQVCLRSTANDSSQDYYRSIPAISDEELRLGPSRAHFQKKYHEIKPLATGQNGETFLAVPREAAATISQNVGSYQSQEELFDALRANVIVAKFPKKGRGTDDLANEIKFLTTVLPESAGDGNFVPISQPLDYHKNNDSLWLTLGLAKGGDLHSFIKGHRRDMTLGLRWHIGLKLAEAVAYLLYGEKDLSSDTGMGSEVWPTLCQGDFHTGNILLTSSSEGSYEDYPDLKLADFGRAGHHVKRASSKTATALGQPKGKSLSHIKNQQCIDTRSAANILLGICLIHHYGKVCKNSHCQSDCGQCPRADCETCVKIGKLFGRFEGLSQDERFFYEESNRFLNFQWSFCTHGEAVTFLKVFAKTATERRDKHYVPLSDEASNHLNTEKVSDREIDHALSLGIFKDD